MSRHLDRVPLWAWEVLTVLAAVGYVVAVLASWGTPLPPDIAVALVLAWLAWMLAGRRDRAAQDHRYTGRVAETRTDHVQLSGGRTSVIVIVRDTHAGGSYLLRMARWSGDGAPWTLESASPLLTSPPAVALADVSLGRLMRAAERALDASTPVGAP